MTRNNRPPNVLWLGADTDGLGWLLSRMSLEANVTAVHSSFQALITAPEQLDTHCRDGIDRIVVACEDRPSYPLQLIAWLQLQFPEIPLAVATGTWWAGAGRTGIRPTSHLTIPWYRWWDSWTDWLEGSKPGLHSPCVTPTAHTGVPSTSVSRASGHGQIIAGRKDMAETWAIFARASGCTVESQTDDDEAKGISHQVCDDAKSTAGQSKAVQQDWVLWDDSCLDTTASQQVADQLIPWIRKVRLENPNACILCALSLPRWSIWKQALEAGADELVVKPTAGFDFSRIVSRAPPIHAL